MDVRKTSARKTEKRVVVSLIAEFAAGCLMLLFMLKMGEYILFVSNSASGLSLLPTAYYLLPYFTPFVQLVKRASIFLLTGC